MDEIIHTRRFIRRINYILIKNLLKKSLLVIVFTVSILILIVPTNSYAGTPALSIQCEDMIGSTSGDTGFAPSVNTGSITLVSQIDGSQAFIGDPTLSGSLSGLAFDSTGRLWGTTSSPSAISELLEINPNTGAQISSIPITNAAGAPGGIQDLSVQPGTDIIYGTTHRFDTAFNSGGIQALVTIDTTTGIGTVKGLIAISGGDVLPIGFAPDGTLYLWSFNTFTNNIA